MSKLRDVKTIEKEMKKRQEMMKKEQDRIRSLNGELSAAKKREKARRYQAIGSAIEDVLGVGELSWHDLKVLVDYLQMHIHFKNGVQTTRAAQVAGAIKSQRAKVSAVGKPTQDMATSADSKPDAVPSGRQGFTGTGNGSTLPFPPPAKPNPTTI
ncbi:MAG: hypothetical protein SOU14_08285 [Succiniclasticum sp.]|nr:hypothetical protein [Succiniclasticum sp.]